MNTPSPGARVLVTNDDGIDAPGLAHLSDAVSSAGLRPLVVAPDRNVSGAGTGIGQFDIGAGVDLVRHDWPAGEAYSLTGPPGLAVLSGALGAFGDPPELVVSGINAGVNTGHSVIHSGTVGAALTARTFGCSGLAVSLAPPDPPSDPWHWETAGAVARQIIRWLVDLGRHDIVLNVNVPALPSSSLRGIRWTRLEDFGHIRVASVDAEGRRIEYGIDGPPATADDGGTDDDRADDEGTDHALLRRGYVTVTPLTGVEEAAVPSAALPTL